MTPLFVSRRACIGSHSCGDADTPNSKTETTRETEKERHAVCVSLSLFLIDSLGKHDLCKKRKMRQKERKRGGLVGPALQETQDETEREGNKGLLGRHSQRETKECK